MPEVCANKGLLLYRRLRGNQCVYRGLGRVLGRRRKCRWHLFDRGANVEPECQSVRVAKREPVAEPEH